MSSARSFAPIYVNSNSDANSNSDVRFHFSLPAFFFSLPSEEAFVSVFDSVFDSDLSDLPSDFSPVLPPSLFSFEPAEEPRA